MNWAVGKAYYMVKGSLLKRGFSVVNAKWQDKQRMLCRCKFDNGGETVELVYNVKQGSHGQLVCDKVVDVVQCTYDSAGVKAAKPLDETQKYLVFIEKLPQIIGTAVKEALAETDL